jgi:hypothetical protein
VPSRLLDSNTDQPERDSPEGRNNLSDCRFNWDPTSDGKTGDRGGYSPTFVNEEAVTIGRRRRGNVA